MKFCSPVELPLVGFKVSQSISSVTDQSSVPPPEFRTLNVWFGGSDPPSIAVKAKLEGLKAMVGSPPERYMSLSP